MRRTQLMVGLTICLSFFVEISASRRTQLMVGPTYCASSFFEISAARRTQLMVGPTYCSPCFIEISAGERTKLMVRPTFVVCHVSFVVGLIARLVVQLCSSTVGNAVDSWVSHLALASVILEKFQCRLDFCVHLIMGLRW
jgi:hypothetical protein